jgi:hypothetical protein
MSGSFTGSYQVLLSVFRGDSAGGNTLLNYLFGYISRAHGVTYLPLQIIRVYRLYVYCFVIDKKKNSGKVKF